MTPKQGNGDMPGLVSWRAGLDIQPDAAVLHPEQPSKLAKGDTVHVLVEVTSVVKDGEGFFARPLRVSTGGDELRYAGMLFAHSDVTKIESRAPRPIKPGDRVRVVNAVSVRGDYDVVAIHNTWAWCVPCDDPSYGGDLIGLSRLERIA